MSCYKKLKTNLIVAIYVATFMFSGAVTNAAVFHNSNFSGIQSTLPLLIHPVVVFGEDTRRDLPDNFNHIDRYIGLLQYRRGKIIENCTAFCINPEIIGTTAHCLFLPDKNGRQRQLSNFIFKAGKGDKAVQSRIFGYGQKNINWNVVAGTTFPGRGNPTDKWFYDRSYDWALIRLAHPVCQSGYFEILPKPLPDLIEAALKKQIFHVAYHKFSKRFLLKYTDDCPVNSEFAGFNWIVLRKSSIDPKNFVPHRYDVGKGSSGSPLLLVTPEGPAVVAVHSGVLYKTIKFNKKIRKLNVLNRAISAAAFNSQIDLLSKGLKVPSVVTLKEVQEILRHTGDYKGRIDGVYGKRMRQAILDFERRHKLPVSGWPTQKIIAKLRSGGAIAPPEKAIAGFENYLYSPGFTDFKAFAVDPKSGRWKIGWGKQSLSTAIDSALDGCSKGKSSCKLYAVGNTIVLDKPDKEINFIANTYKRRTIDNRVLSAFEEYLKNSKILDFKALAINPNTGLASSSSGEATPTEAINRAIQKCEIWRKPCLVYAIDDIVVYRLSEAQLQSVIEEYERAVSK